MIDQRILVRWLREQITEDEAHAVALHAINCEGAPDECYCDWPLARIQAECAAKREIIKLVTEGFGLDARAYMHAWVESMVEDQDEPKGIATPILRALALPYNDRDGYREEWRP